MIIEEKKSPDRVTRILIHMLLVLIPVHLSGSPDHWESVIRTGSPCRYLVPGSPVDSGWTDLSYDDSGWESGPGGVGYGDEDDLTPIGNAISVYCRYHFNLSEPSVIEELILDMDFDDGFVAYLNGVELARYYMGQPGSATWWDQEADGLHEATMHQGMDPMRFLLDPGITGLLYEGDNVLSVEVHNGSVGSSDLSSNVYLHAGISTEDRYFDETPDWFHPPVPVDSTHLPLVIIDSDGIAIPNEPRITAQMGIIDKGPGHFNSPTDPFNVYEGLISIETRGESSQGLYPKKSYSIETQTDSGTNNNVSLLGLPGENDYVLYGPYGDKSLIRNAISYRLYELMGHYAPRIRFVEMVVNDDYVGLYLLVEKIKRDRNRVDISRITPDDTSALEISGGYILRIDKTTGMEPFEYWESSVQPSFAGFNRVTYQYFDPDYFELTGEQRNYIREYLEAFEKALVSAEYKDPVEGYRSYLDIPSFIDMMILNEFTKDVDGFKLSHYFYKQRDDHGGRLVQGPPWDYNLTFGNNDFAGDVNSTENWICRWDDLFSTILDPEQMQRMIDGILEDMEDPIARNYERWPTFGQYIWPNSFVGENYQDEEEYLRDWISDRLAWMESKWGGVCVPVSVAQEPLIPRPGTLKVYPNPSDLSSVFVSVPFSGATMVRIRIFDSRGTVVFGSQIEMDFSEYAFRLPDLSRLPSGVYLVEVSDGEQRRAARIIRQ